MTYKAIYKMYQIHNIYFNNYWNMCNRIYSLPKKIAQKEE